MRVNRLDQASARDVLANALCCAGAAVAAASLFVVLIAQVGWVWGLLLGWALAAPAAAVGAFLLLVWTMPLRAHDILSLNALHPRRGATAARGVGGLKISVIMPVYNAFTYMQTSLPPLMDLVKRGELCEVIVADDGSTDASADYARSLGAVVVPSGGRKGPAEARNVAARFAKCDIIWFVDGDVVVKSDGARVLARDFADPDVVAVFGSYDDLPAATNFASQYKNLVHHHYHQNSNPDASTFWSGCGAVRKHAFEAVGGYDGTTYTAPSVEDVELGSRLRSIGKIRLDRNLLSTHLKRWSLIEVVRTDVFCRALPWARLMLRKKHVIDDMNVGTVERLRAAYAGLTVLALAAAALGLIRLWWLAPVLLTNVSANWHLFRLFSKARGVAFGLGGLAFHQLYYLYSAATFVFCWVEARVAAPVADRQATNAAPADPA